MKKNIKDVSTEGITLEKVLSLTPDQIGRMKYDELLPYAKAAARFANQRRATALKKFDEYGITPSITYSGRGQNRHTQREFVDYSTVNFSITNETDRNALVHKLKIARMFLDNKTSTFEGYMESVQDFASNLQRRTGVDKDTFDITKGENFRQFFLIYNELARIYPTIDQAGQSNNILRPLAEDIRDYLDRRGRTTISNQARRFIVRRVREIIEQNRDRQYREEYENDDNPYKDTESLLYGSSNPWNK